MLSHIPIQLQIGWTRWEKISTRVAKFGGGGTGQLDQLMFFFVKTKPNSNSIQLGLRLDTVVTIKSVQLKPEDFWYTYQYLLVLVKAFIAQLGLGKA